MYYNFTKFHENWMKNKIVLLMARFSVQNFKVSVELWKSYIVRFSRQLIWSHILIFWRVSCFASIHFFGQYLPSVQKAWENKSFSQRVSLNFADDSVYMRTRAHLNEYLLNDVGKVYQGSYKTPIGRDWAFGQFEAAVLPAAFFLLDKSQLRPTERGNPIKVSRAISAMGKRHALKNRNSSQ